MIKASIKKELNSESYLFLIKIFMHNKTIYIYFSHSNIMTRKCSLICLKGEIFLQQLSVMNDDNSAYA